MKCLTTEEVEKIFGPLGFYVQTNNQHMRAALRLNIDDWNTPPMVGGRPDRCEGLLYLVEEINRWLPNQASRLLWIDSWEDGFPSALPGFEAIRQQLGESESIAQKRGHLFREHNYADADILSMSDTQAKDSNAMFALITLAMVGGWDFWLVSDKSTDRVEFWEGNVLFHSMDKVKMRRAKEIMKRYSIPKKLS